MLATLSILPLTAFIVKVSTTQPYGYDIAFYIEAGVSVAACALLAQLKMKYDWRDEASLLAHK